jgi:hypothetical protein
MRLIHLFPAALLASTPALPAAGQMPDLVSGAAQYMPGAALEHPRPAEAQVTSYDAAFNVPAPLGESTFLIPGASYHVEAVSFARAPAELVELRAFHAVDGAVLFVQLLPERWSLSLRVSAGIAGDLEAVDGDLVRVNALALATHAFSDRFVLGGGALASYAFGSLLPLPAAYVEWKPDPVLTLEAFLPAFAHVRLALWDRVELGYRAEVAGNAYGIRDERITGAWPCAATDTMPAEPDACFDHVAYSVITMGPTLSLRLFSSVWFDVSGGHSVLRRFEQMNGDDEPIPGGVQDLPNVPFVRSGFTWRIPRD